jgi:putative two-component system response regulator
LLEVELDTNFTRLAKLLVIDDDKNFLFGISRMLAKANYDVISASEGFSGIIKAQKEQPNLIILDVNMPVMNGFQVKKALEKNPDTAHIPVIFLTALTDRASTLGGMEMAEDYIYKPFDAEILVAKLRAVLRRLESGYNQAVFESKKLIFSSDQFHQWGQAVEVHDYGTAGHTLRVMEWFGALAKSLGLENGLLDMYKKGAMVHDIGKLAIAESILSKPGPLDEEEWKIMKLHPQYGFDMLSAIHVPDPILEIPLNHHERWDGNGYPNKKSGADIPLASRAFSVVDVYDALISRRPYKVGFKPQDAWEIIQAQSGTFFDPDIVDHFLANFNSLKKEVDDESVKENHGH